MKQELRLRDIAALEMVSLRQVQRWVAAGELCASISGAGRIVKREDYLAFQQKREALRQVSPEPSVVTLTTHPAPVSASSEEAHPEPSGAKSPRIPSVGPVPTDTSSPGDSRPAHLRPAVEGGPLTNVPHPTSGNWPDPNALRAHYEAEAQAEKDRLLGRETTTHEYDDFEI